MKIFTIIIVLFYLLSTPMYSKEQQTQEETISRLIQKIKKSPPSDRRLAMNKLKILLRTMNQKTRKRVMSELQKTFASHHPRFGKPPHRSIPGREHQNGSGGHAPTIVAPHNPNRGTPHTSPGRRGPMRNIFPGGHR